MYRSLLGRTGLRPIQIRAESPRYAWIAAPAYRAQIAVPATVRVEQPKKRRTY